MFDNFQHPYLEAEDFGAGQVRFADNVIGNVEGIANVYPKNLEETLTILGERGTVVIVGVEVNKMQVLFAGAKDSLEDVQAECNNEIDSVYGNDHAPLCNDWL